MNYLEENFKEILFALSGAILLIIIGFLYHYFDQKKWRKNLKKGDGCSIRHGSEKIQNCKIICDLGDKAVVQDCWDHVRTVRKKDIYKPLI